MRHESTHQWRRLVKHAGEMRRFHYSFLGGRSLMLLLPEDHLSKNSRSPCQITTSGTGGQYRIGCKPRGDPIVAQRHAGLYLLRYRADHAAATSKTSMAKITVKIEDGTVTTIDGIPTDVTVEVRNYDESG